MRFRITHSREGDEAITLVLTSTEQPQVKWRRRYSNRLELGFDALELNLLDSRTPEAGVAGFRNRLREEADIDEQQLKRFQFVKEQH